MTSGNFDAYPLAPADPPEVKLPEDGFPMTVEADYVFSNDYKQPPFAIAPVIPDPSRISRLARNLDALDPKLSDLPDLAVNQAIVNAAALAVRNRPQKDLSEAPRESIPSTYEPLSFILDADVAYATDLLCTAWLELYNRQVETGDFPVVKEIRSRGNSRQLQRFVPRKLTDLPNGSISENVEIFLSPEMYAQYVAADLIPETPGGQDGVPRIYWFEHDGDGFKAGSNTDQIHRTEKMNPLSAANVRGTYNSVDLALKRFLSS